jgi:hypothetical protein
MCHECREDLTSLAGRVFDHFQKTGATCALHDKAGVDRHAEESDTAETEAIRKAEQEDPTLDVAKLRVATEAVRPATAGERRNRGAAQSHGNRHS